MKFEDWWNTENIIEFSNEPDDYSKAKYVYEAVYKVNNFAEANDVDFHCCMSDKWEDEDYAED